MTRFSTFLFCMLLINRADANTPADTLIQRVRVVFKFDPSVFPESWQAGSVLAKGESIDTTEIARCKLITAKALNKYPSPLLYMNLKTIYFLRSEKFFNVGFGGTYTRDALFISDNGKSLGYTDRFIEQSIHHEFSSILFNNYGWLLDTSSWTKANLPGSGYTDPEAGVGAIRKNEASQELDTALAQQGFLTQYAHSDIENDINTIAQNLFSPNPGFWNIVDKYPRIRQKVNLLIRFYHSIIINFTEAYFREFEKEKQ
ncbi:MAG TPA: hypothetical protein VLJ68_00695 [Chitinophagaceae bacterium]|nr:hypothetical protein [Chitinophagaceae bacterium]